MRGERGVLSLVGLLQAAAVLTVVFSFVTGIDIPHRNIELFSHFRLQYFVVSILLVVVFALLRSPVYAGTLLITAVFNGSFILPWYLNDAPTSSGVPLKLVLANVHSTNTNYQRLIDFVRSEDPDMIFLQEVTAQWVDGTKELLQDYPHAYTESRRGNFGIAMFSKTPLESIRHFDSPPLSHPTLVATTMVNGDALTLISSHPTIPVGRFLYESRNEQLRSVADLVDQATGKIVLLGDFNASIWCAHYRKLEAATGLVNVRRGVGILPSWPTFLPFAMIPIDHALVSEDIGVVEARIGKNIGSDHLPLVVTITL